MTKAVVKVVASDNKDGQWLGIGKGKPRVT